MNNKQIILNNYLKLLRNSRQLLTNQDITLIRKAFTIVIENSHEGKKISEQEFLHILDVTLIVVNEIGLGRTSIICTLLYLSVQRNLISLEQLNSMFGAKVVQIVKGLTDISNIYQTKKLSDTDNFRKLLLTFAEDIRVQLIFLAEKLYSLHFFKKFISSLCNIGSPPLIVIC